MPLDISTAIKKISDRIMVEDMVKAWAHNQHDKNAAKYMKSSINGLAQKPQASVFSLCRIALALREDPYSFFTGYLGDPQHILRVFVPVW